MTDVKGCRHAGISKVEDDTTGDSLFSLSAAVTVDIEVVADALASS